MGELLTKVSTLQVAKSLQENGIASTASLSKLSTLAEQGSTVSATSTETDGPGQFFFSNIFILRPIHDAITPFPSFFLY